MLEDSTGTSPLRRKRLSDLLLTLPFLLLYWLDLFHHQSWFDEVNAWGISAASPNLRTLFHLVHYEGHPWLWYFLLYWPSRLTHDPNAMKGVVALFGTAVFLLLGLLSPFTKLQKVLLFLSYFVAWEYTVLLRMYVIMLLLTLIYAWRRSRRPDGVLGNLLLLGLLTNVDMTGAVLSGALLVEYVYTLLFARDGQIAVPRQGRNGRLALGLLLYFCLFATSVLTLLPAKDISWQTSGHLGQFALEFRNIRLALTNVIAGPWWPISPRFPHHFWGTDARVQHWLLLLVPIVLFAYWRSVRRQRNLVILMTAAVLFAFIWADVVYMGQARHWGVCFCAFVVALWIESSGQPADRQAWSPWAYGLLGLGALAGSLATVSTWVRPFSQSQAAARWIQTHEPADVAITGQPDVSFVSVAQHLQRPVFQLECNCVETYKLFSRAHENFDNRELGARLDTAFSTIGRPSVLFLFWEPLTPELRTDLQAHGLQADLLTSFTGAEFMTENYYIYRLTRTAALTGRSAPAQ